MSYLSSFTTFTNYRGGYHANVNPGTNPSKSTVIHVFRSKIYSQIPSENRHKNIHGYIPVNPLPWSALEKQCWNSSR